MLELLFEFVFQIVLEVLGDLIVHGLSINVRKPHAAVAFIGYAIAGAAVGFVTILVFPEHFIRGQALRVANLIVTPLAIGALMAWIGRTRDRRDKRVVRLERFAYAYAFALAIALVRFVVAS